MLKDDIMKWATLYRRPTLKSTSYDTLLKTVQNYILPVFGDCNTNQISSDDVAEFMMMLQYEKQYSYSTLKKIKETLNCFYEYAVRRKIANTNVVKDIKCKNSKQNQKNPPRALNDVEIQRFINSALEQVNGKYRYYYGSALVIYLHTGLRLGELIALAPDDYNPKTGEIHIHSDIECMCSYDTKGNKLKGCEIIHQDTPKTSESNRKIIVNDTAKHYLNYYYRQSQLCDGKYLIMSPKKKMVTPSAIQSTYYYVIKNANIKNTRGVHTLRHTCATHLIRNGVDVKIVSKILGHASVKITYDTYIHLFETDVPDALNLLDGIFKQKHEFTACEVQ